MLAPTYSPSCEVPSVVVGLTSVFGMRTGGPPPPKHQHRIFNIFVVLYYLEHSEVVTLFKRSELLVGAAGFEPATSPQGNLLSALYWQGALPD